MEKKPNRVTRKMINDALHARGRDESLYEGDGFYFGGGEAVHWLSSSVMVKRLSDLTLEEWLREFDTGARGEAAEGDEYDPRREASQQARTAVKDSQKKTLG